MLTLIPNKLSLGEDPLLSILNSKIPHLQGMIYLNWMFPKIYLYIEIGGLHG